MKHHPLNLERALFWSTLAFAIFLWTGGVTPANAPVQDRYLANAEGNVDRLHDAISAHTPASSPVNRLRAKPCKTRWCGGAIY